MKKIIILAILTILNFTDINASISLKNTFINYKESSLQSNKRKGLSLFSRNNSEKSQTQEPHKQESKEESIGKKDSVSNFFKIVIYSLIIILFGLLGRLYFFLGDILEKQKEVQKKLKDFSSTLKNQNSVQNKPQPSLAKNDNKNTNYVLSKKDYDIIVDKVVECIRKEKEELEIKDKFKSGVKYLKGKQKDLFTIVANNPDNSFFQLLDEVDDTASFTFIGNDSEAIAKRVFSGEICEIVSGNQSNAKNVEVIKKGKLRKEGSHWKVIEPLKINLK